MDFLRGIAILLVLDFHAPIHWLTYPLHMLGFPNFGWVGVSVFFVLSGFLVGGLLFKEWKLRGQIDSSRFLIRRGFKIWPQYYVFLGLMLVSGHRSLHALWGNIVNLQNYVGGIPHTWSLAVEEHAYLFLVLLLWIAAKRKVRASSLAWLLAGLAMVVVVIRILLITTGRYVVTQTHTRVEGILYGVILAMLYHYRPALFRNLQQRWWIWVGACVAAMIFLRYQTAAPWATSVGWDAADLLGVGLLMVLYRPRPSVRPAAYRLIAWIGVYSYGIYLWHVAVIAPNLLIAAHMPHELTRVWIAVAPLVSGVVLGAFFTKVIELPALRLRDRLYPRRIDSPVGAPAILENRIPQHELELSAQTAGA